MVLPVVIGGGAALASAITGLKKAWDAKKNFSTAGELIKDAEHVFGKAAQALEKRREEVSGQLNLLARQRMEICSNSLETFQRLVDAVAASDISAIRIEGHNLPIDIVPIKEIEKARYEAIEFLQHGIKSVAAGVTVGAGVAQAVGTLGAASTGAAISGLSGAAATNATLAWLGGGSLASGGFGMAGGAMVLNGVIAGPALMVMGYLAAGKSEKALTEAETHAAELEKLTEQLSNASEVLNAITLRAQELADVLQELDARFQDAANRVSRMVGRIRREREARYLDADLPVPEEITAAKIEYIQLGSKDRDRFEQMLALGSALYTIAKIAIIDKEGGVTTQSAEAIEETKLILGSK